VYQFKAVEGRQHGRRILSGFIKAGDLASMYGNHIIMIDRYDPAINPEGYQRNPSQSRSRRFGRYIGDGKLSSDSINLYIRDPKGSDMLHQNKDGWYTIDPSRGIHLYLTDGQTRTEGVSVGLAEGWLKDPDFDVPMTLVVSDPSSNPSDSKFEEAELFYRHNKEQARMRTDLAHQFLFKRISRTSGPIGDSTVFPRLKKKDYPPYAIFLANRLRIDAGSPWYGRIATPNNPKSAPVTEGSFTDSLTPVLTDAIAAHLTLGQTITLLSNYWKAIMDLCSDSVATPEKYHLLKTPGIFSLHLALPNILRRRPNLGQNPSQEQFKNVLQSMGNVFTDAFWDSAAGDAADYGTNRAENQKLADAILDELP
jgi:DGQHR domain-containing protein